MFKVFFSVMALTVSLASSVGAQDRVTLGWGRMFTNDVFGDGKDRWKTGSYTVSRIRGASWDGTLPDAPGALLEFRLRAETIAPADLVTPDPTDRRYAGAISAGIHSHFMWSGFETSLGMDLVVIGPQTGLGRFQTSVHDLIGLPKPTVLGDQIEDQIRPTLVAEMGRTLSLGDRARMRPFIEAQAGAENFVRLGGDLTFGHFGQGALMLRDHASGQRYSAVSGDKIKGFSFVVGGDFAQVYSSVYLPDGGAVEMSDTRTRLRAGVHWQQEKAELFYGVTYLGKEFETQPEGQVVGSLSLKMRF